MQVGTVVVPKASIAVNRNYDFDFLAGESEEPPYRFSKPVSRWCRPWAALWDCVSVGVLMDTVLGPRR